MRIIPLMVFAVGCTGDVTFPGTDMTGFFEFENNVGYQWQFANEDIALTYRMVGQIEDYFTVDGAFRYEMVYRTDCIAESPTDCADGELIRSMVFTSDYNGIQIWGANGEDFDAPVKLANQFMKVGDTIESQARGHTYTVTMDAIGGCPVRLANWDNCAHFVVTSNDGDDDITGEYWAVQSFNIVAVSWPDQPGRWELVNHVNLEDGRP